MSLLALLAKLFGRSRRNRLDALPASVLDAAEEAIVSVNATRTIVFANRAAAAMFDYPIEALVGQPLATLIPDDAKAAHRAFVETFAAAPESSRMMGTGGLIHCRRRDGHQFEAQASINNGRVGGRRIYTAIIRRPTPQRLPDEEQRRVTTLTEALFAVTPVAVVTLDTDFRIVLWNQGAERTFGWRADEVLGRQVPFMPPLHERDELSAIEATLRAGETVRAEAVRFRKDGSRVDVDQTLVPLRAADGHVEGVLAIILDITGNKRTIAALKQSVRQFRRLANSLPDVVARFDVDGRHLYVNNRAPAFTGIPRHLFLGRTPGELPLPSHLTRSWESAIQRVVETGQRVDLHSQVPMPYDRLGQFEVAFVPERRPHGPVETVLAIGHDVTTRDEAEAVLRKSEQRFRSLLENLPDLVVILDERGTIEFINYTLPEYTVAQVTGTLVTSYLSPEDGRRYMQAIEEVIAHGERRDLDIASVGPTYWAVRLVPYARDGEAAAVLAIATDVTERKWFTQSLNESQEQFQKVMDTMAQAYWLVDPVKRLTLFVSPAFESIWGCLRREAYENYDFWRTHTHRQDRERMAGLFESVAGGASYDSEYRIVRSDGTVRWIRERAYLLSYTGGATRRICGFSEDITERREANRILQASRSQLRRLADHLMRTRERERAAVARELHDQLGQSLTALKFDLANAADDAGDAGVPRERVEKLMRQVDDSIDSVRRIATDLRPPELDQLGLPAAIRARLRAFERRTHLACLADVGSVVLDVGSDATTALYRILQEALTNIARHAGASTVTVTLKDDGDDVLLVVEDNGRGFDEDRLQDDDMFGLTSMRERAELLGGSCSIAGVAGEGTTVTVRLPRARAASHDDAAG